MILIRASYTKHRNLHASAEEIQIPNVFQVRICHIYIYVFLANPGPTCIRLCWYVGDKFLRDLKGSTSTEHTSRVLKSILALAEFLVSEARILENGSEQAKKEVKEQIPSDRVKDAPAMARELRWRVKHATGYLSDDDSSTTNHRAGPNGNKRKRMESTTPENEAPVRFKNFQPKKWDGVKEEDAVNETNVLRGRPPIKDEWVEEWTTMASDLSVEGEEAEVKRRRETIVKVRKTSRGLERQRIERVVEEWTWGKLEQV